MSIGGQLECRKKWFKPRSTNPHEKQASADDGGRCQVNNPREVSAV
jgi:hypothetical protein